MKDLKKAKRLILLLEVLGLLLFVGEILQQHVFVSDEIERLEAREGVEEHEYTVEADGHKESVTVEVSPKARTKEEIASLLAAAKEEVDVSYLGANTDATHVQQNLVLQKAYVEDQVDAAWSASPGSYIDTDGSLRFDYIEEATEVYLTVTLRCEEQSETVDYKVVVYPPSVDTPEGFQYELEHELKRADEEYRTEDVMRLPQELDGLRLRWIPKGSYGGLQLCLLGIAAWIGIAFAKKEEERQAQKKLQKALQADYPNIVNWLSLYVGAGMSMKQAFSIIGKEASEEHPGYEAVLRCSRSMADGKSEMAAYEDLSTYAPDKNYRKLSLLITHHLRKGSEDLMFQLEREATNAFEQRKMLAKVAGEEASTKLLIPMMGLLGIILIVLVIPALRGINI